jgi:hypothetical protein
MNALCRFRGVEEMVTETQRGAEVCSEVQSSADMYQAETQKQGRDV